jgi:hypothetical protein
MIRKWKQINFPTQMRIYILWNAKLWKKSDALSALKNHKAPAADNIPAKLLKYGGDEVINAIYDSITLTLELEQIPDEWK